MSEQLCPHPENQKPNAPEPAAGPLGIPPPPDTEAAQGRAEGRESLQGPTTVDHPEQLPSSTSLPYTPQEHATTQQESAVNNPPLSPEERREKRRKYLRNYRQKNRDKLNEYQTYYYSHGPKIRPNKKLREHQWRLAQERMEKRREQ